MINDFSNYSIGLDVLEDMGWSRILTMDLNDIQNEIESIKVKDSHAFSFFAMVFLSFSMFAFCFYLEIYSNNSDDEKIYRKTQGKLLTFITEKLMYCLQMLLFCPIDAMYPKRIMPFLIAVFHHLMQVEDYAFWHGTQN